MSPTTNSTTLLPHEIDQIDQIFADILRGLGLSRKSEAAEAIAIRIINCYQGGVRESGALKQMIGFYKSAALRQTHRPKLKPSIDGRMKVALSHAYRTSTY